MATLWSIGEIIPDIVIDETVEDSLEITSHPVQQGASISDHAFKKPITVKISLQFASFELYDKLLKLQNDRTLSKLTTPNRIYNNMILEGLTRTTDSKTFNIISVTANLREIIIVEVKTTSVPPSANHKNSKKTGATENSGAKNTQPVAEPKKKSALRTLFG